MRLMLVIAAASLALTCSVPAFAGADAAPGEAGVPAETAAPAQAPTAAAEAADPAVTADASSEPGYVGTWADDPEQCAKPQDVEGAPMIMGKDRFDQHETHCTFTSVSAHDDEWKVSAKCSVEGDDQAYDFGLSLAEKELTMLDDTGAHIYSRCN